MGYWYLRCLSLVLCIGKEGFLVSSGVSILMPSAALVILCQCFKMICSMTGLFQFESIANGMVMLNVRIVVETLWEFATFLKWFWIVYHYFYL
jgi:hypothetical protein